MWRVPFSLMVGPVVLALAGIGIGLVFQAPAHADVWVTAIATAALTYFAWTEALRNREQDEAREAGMRHRLESVARLARRSCDATIAADGYYAMGREWAKAVRFGPLQEQFLEVRTLAAQLGGGRADAATRAFEAFLSAADRVNLLADARAAMSLADSAARRHEALGYLRDAADALHEIAPRLGDEHPLPAGEIPTVG